MEPIVVTHKQGLILNSKAMHGNPYDGHTLKESIHGAEANSECIIDRVFPDKAYRGHNLEGKEVFISGKKA